MPSKTKKKKCWPDWTNAGQVEPGLKQSIYEQYIYILMYISYSKYIGCKVLLGGFFEIISCP
jgi:hypothetical protein